MPRQLRWMFCYLLAYNGSTMPIELWNQFKYYLSEDYRRNLSVQDAEQRALADIAEVLRSIGRFIIFSTLLTKLFHYDEKF